VRHADTFCYDASGKKPILGLHPVPTSDTLDAHDVVAATPIRPQAPAALAPECPAFPLQSQPIEPLKDDLSCGRLRSSTPPLDATSDPGALQRLCEELAADADFAPNSYLVTLLVPSFENHVPFASLTVAGSTHTIDLTAYGDINLFTALRPLFQSPAVQIAIHDVHHILSTLASCVETVTCLVDTQLAFEHLTGHMDVGLKEFIAACPGEILHPTASGSTPAPGKSGPEGSEMLARQYFAACKAILSLIDDDLAIIRLATLLRARSVPPPAGGFRRIAFDERCDCRLTSHALLSALRLCHVSTADDSANRAPVPWGSAYLIADVLLGRPDLHVLVIGPPDCRARVFREIAHTLSESRCVLHTDGDESADGSNPPSNLNACDVMILPEISSAHDARVRDIFLSVGGPRVIFGASGTLRTLLYDSAFSALFGGIVAADSGGGLCFRRRGPPVVGCLALCQEDVLTLTMDVAGAVDALLAEGVWSSWERTCDAAGALFQRRVTRI
jgi:hypothetical protein